MNNYIFNTELLELIDSTSAEEILISRRLESNYAFACSRLAMLRERRRITNQQFDLAAKTVYDFLKEMDNLFDMDNDIFEFGEFMNTSMIVNFRNNPNLYLKLHYDLEDDADVSDQCLLVYPEDNQPMMRNDSVHNIVEFLKQIL